jgi:hypothetical protein
MKCHSNLRFDNEPSAETTEQGTLLSSKNEYPSALEVCVAGVFFLPAVLIGVHNKVSGLEKSVIVVLLEVAIVTILILIWVIKNQSGGEIKR